MALITVAAFAALASPAGTPVLDADAYGRMYIRPVELRAFEQDPGATNRQTETNAGPTVERIPSPAFLGTASGKTSR